MAKTSVLLAILVARRFFGSAAAFSSSYDSKKAAAAEIAFDANMKNKIASSAAKTERREIERRRGPRDTCERCARPPDLCICESLPDRPISTSTTILVLQHPRERRRKSLSTVPLMPLVLDRIQVKVGFDFVADDLELVKDYLDSGRTPLLLFPGKNAISLDQKCDDEDQEDVIRRLQSEEQLLVVLDGTWSEARGMYLRSQALMNECQQVQFESETDSIYPVDLRKEPQRHCVSTLESCAQALMLLEPSKPCAAEAKEYLESSMQCMVDKRMQVSRERNREPRFERASSRIYAKNKRKHELKKILFSKG